MEKKWKLAFSVVRLGIFEFCFYIQVNLIITLSLGSIETDRVISETVL